jgi:thimet oligopeptidase
MRHVLFAAAVAAAVPAASQPVAHPLLPVLDAPALTSSCEEGLARARAGIAQMKARADATAFFVDWNRQQIVQEDVAGPVSILGSLHPDKAVRDAAEPCLARYTALSTEIFQDEAVFALVKAARPADAREEKLKKNLLEGFEDSGVALAPAKRARAKEIFARLEALRQSFERNLRDDPTLVKFSPVELDGLPQAFLEDRKRDADGNFLLKPDDPTFTAFMANARSESARKRFHVARFNVGGEANIALMDEMYRLRKELANLYGLPTYAHYALRRKMAGTPEAVTKFLAEVHAAVAEPEKRELAELAGAKAKDMGADARLQRWDVAYYQERIKQQRFKVDQEKLRAYFPTGKAVEYALLVSETLYGVKFREATAPTWQADVRYFEVSDAASGRFIASIYLDLYPRDGKRGGAWASGVRRASRLEGRTPISVLATNFNRQGLTQGEMRTLLHEFGHVLHGIFSTAQYVAQAGTSVKRDFVEAPSQMFEAWTRRDQPLALFRKVCSECPRLSAEELQQLELARRYGIASRYAGQWVLASFDMALSLDPQPPNEAWKRVEGATPLGFVEGVLRPASFQHLASAGYASGYYGYMWSEVIALDLLSAFDRDMLDPKVGARYREVILSRGSEKEEVDMVREFLGRDPSSEAFFAEVSGKR